jgi:Ca-activated chloride channel family protein
MRQTLISALLLIGLSGAAEPQVAEPFQISVNVDLVLLQPVVHDRNGQFASDLRERDFAVYEDGVRQSIKLFRHEDIPVTVGLVVDHSGSMKPKLADVITAARTFAEASRPDDRMFVVNFNEKVTLRSPDANLPDAYLPNAPQAGNRSDALARAISGTPAAGKTALYDAAIEAFRQLPTSGPEKKVLIVISDGGDNASVHTLADAMRAAAESSTLIYTIGIFDDEDEDRNPGVLNRLARATGGEAFFPRERTEVVAICESIARDIRNQYTIGYVSSNTTRTGAWRSIRLTAAAPGHGKLTVRTRSGYVAGGKSQ